MNENPQSNTVWEEKLTWVKSSPQCRALDTIDCEPMKFECNIFPGFTTLQLVQEVQEFLSRIIEKPEEFTGRIIFMSMFNDITWRYKDYETECIANSTLVSLFAKKISSRMLGISRTWIRKEVVFHLKKERPQGEWDRVGELMMIKFGESGHPVFRATSPLS